MIAKYEPQGIHRRIAFEVTPDLVARFNAKVTRGEPTECWNWAGALRNGYGAIKHRGHVLGSHVVAYRIAKGEVAADQCVKHSCDNRMCCNPDHLTAGTYGENVREMFDRRSVNTSQGIKSYCAVLNDEIVALARALNMVRGYGCGSLSRVIDRNKNTLKGVICNYTWKHLPWPTREEAERIVAEFEATQTK
jgi:hypothetical protein